MPFFGNNVAGGSSLSLTPTDCFGHWGWTWGAWGMPIPACRITMIWVYATGPALMEGNSTAQFGIYDASGGVPVNYPLVATSPTFTLFAAALAQWYFVACNIVLAAGTYSLAILANSAGAFTGSIHHTIKAPGPDIRAFIAPGVFPNPLGGAPTSASYDWSMYADYVPTARVYAPTAACCCQPKCGD